MKTKQTQKPLPPTDSADSHPDMIRETIGFGEGYFGRPVSPEDAREMVANITGFFTLLDEWDHKNQRATAENQGSTN